MKPSRLQVGATGINQTINLQCLQTAVSLLSHRVPGLFPWGVKQQGLEADHSPPTSAEVKNGGPIPRLPHTSSWRGS
jgi:hypothetical protein